jgi:hypothetical protein
LSLEDEKSKIVFHILLKFMPIDRRHHRVPCARS